VWDVRRRNQCWRFKAWRVASRTADALRIGEKGSAQTQGFNYPASPTVLSLSVIHNASSSASASSGKLNSRYYFFVKMRILPYCPPPCACLTRPSYAASQAPKTFFRIGRHILLRRLFTMVFVCLRGSSSQRTGQSQGSMTHCPNKTNKGAVSGQLSKVSDGSSEILLILTLDS
jgi:hypothetical protein